MNPHFSHNLAFINAAQHMHVGKATELTKLLNLDSEMDTVRTKDAEAVLNGKAKLHPGWFEHLRYWNAHIVDTVEAITAPLLQGLPPNWTLFEKHIPKVLMPYAATLVSLELPDDANIRLDSFALN